VTRTATVTRTAIVTGGASGIGAALGAALVARGTTVVLADVDAGGAERTAAELSARGPGRALGVGVDVRDAAAVADVVQRTAAEHGRLDLMVNNAGIAVVGEPEDLLLAHWDRLIDVNLRGVVHGCHAAYPLMKAQGGGHIVNTASIAGVVPCPGQMATYSTTKFAVVGLSLALRAAGADHGVRVSALCPGWTDTAILDRRGPEDLPLPGSAEGPSARSLLADNRVGVYPADRLAADALRGIDANRALIVAPRSARVAVRVARHLPALARRQALAATRTFRRSGDSPALPAPPAPAAQRASAAPHG
jgi:NAD(P)-dependent dehydrogenase (short-subunit alcohol dehydrogenase family)